MAMVLYEGKAIAFGPCEEIFARVRTVTEQAAAARPAAAAPKTARRAPVAEGVEP
jgi:ABC-type glutathione transport system ATPase component